MKLAFHLVFLTVTIATFFTFCEGYYLELLKYNDEQPQSEGEVRSFLADYDQDIQKLRTELVQTKWDFSIDPTEENAQKIKVYSQMVYVK